MSITQARFMSQLRTWILVAGLTALLIGIGALIGGKFLYIFVIFAVVMNVAGYWFSDKIALRASSAKPVSEQEAPQLYRILRELTERAGLPMPRVYIMDNPQPNAFATGRNPKNAAVCASTGLLEMLSAEELAGVMAHELSHVKNRDTLTMALAATIGGAISMLAQFLQFGALFGGNRNNNSGVGWVGTLIAIILAPLAAMLAQMAISRSREYAADRMGGQICGQPLWLASALRKIEGYARQIPNEPAEAAPATAHLFIINPLSGQGMDNLFSTHPNTENRIAELEKLAQEMGASSRRGPSEGPWGRSPGGARGPWG